MTSFRTEIKIDEYPQKIEYYSKIMFLGSCFATNIGEKFLQSRIPSIVNPYGVIYNPLSVATTIRSIIDNKIYTESELQFFNELWHSFDHHSDFSSNDKAECLQKINDNNNKAHNYLKHANFLFITFGTAWVFQLKDTNRIVSNCHKYPSNSFNHFLLNIDEIVETYKKLLTELLVFNPKLNIVFTVSPVRHWKNGAHGNQISKATLLLAIENLTERFESCSYFPAYELLLDDLRDYRFYDTDMIHPGSTAIEYIWNKFENAFFSKNTLQYQKEMIKLDKAIKHKPRNPSGESYKKFVFDQINLLNNYKNKYPLNNFNDEINYFNSIIV